jgi:hypothetical protein
MPNEFIIKNGYFSQGNSEITGSLTVTGGITGSLSGVAASSSFAATASYVNPLTQSVFITGSTFINGNLLIDTTSNLNAKLTINGSGLFRNTSDLEWLGVGSIADVHRIMPYSTNVNIRFLSKTNGYASIGAESLSIGSSYAATVAPSNGAIIQGNVSVGSSTNGAKLDVRAQGALSTDIPFRVRNSADSANLLTLQGDGNIRIGTDVTTTFKLDVNGFVRVGGGAGTAGQLQIVSGTGQYYPTLTWVNNGSSTQGQIAGYGGGLYTQNTGYFQFTSINNVTVGGAYGGRDASALFQVNGTTKGSIPWPRMTAAQRTAITSPVLGLTVYQTDEIAGIYINTSTGWVLNTLSPFPYTGSAQITGSLIVTGSITSTSGITGSLQGTSSWANNATTASYATTSQLTNNAYFAQGIVSADQTIPANTDEIIQFVDQYDPQGWYDSGTYQFTPTIEGYYTVSLGVWFENPNDNTNQLNVQMRVNGNQEMILQQPSTTVTGVSLFGTKIVYLNGSGDYIDFTAYQGTGGNINILQGNSAGSGTWFSATYMTM